MEFDKVEARKKPKESPCLSCKYRDTCDILKVYQVVIYKCLCLEYEKNKEIKIKIRNNF